MADVKIILPDGSAKEYAAGTTLGEAVKKLSNSLAKKVLAANVNGELTDLREELVDGSEVAFLTFEEDGGKHTLRHTASHVMAQAVKRLWPEAKLAIGPAIDKGFYYDIDMEHTLTPEDLTKIEKEMSRIVKENLPITKSVMSRQEAIEFFKSKNEDYKVELIEDLPEDAVISCYAQGDFVDLCAGPHVASTGKVKAFKLQSIAGAYWRGDEKNKMLQRIYGTVFEKKEELDAYLHMLEEAAKRDHRKLGKELGLFVIKEEGPGFPFFLPKGMALRNELENFWREVHHDFEYDEIRTPIILNKHLWETSGHWDHYREDMFPPMDMGDGEEFVLRPMNCPHHIEVYKHHVHSYRELPIRIAEIGMMHRYEKSGALTGLQRVREMSLNDGHTFVAPEQIEEEFKKILQLIIDVYEDFNLTDYRFRLSYRDPADKHKYFDNDEMWENAQRMLKAAVDDMGVEYYEAEGEAAFYGPKLDIQVKTALGKEETLSTIQLDFLLPERFDLHYIGADGEEHRPVMIHRGVISTMERFTAILIENYKGAFPTWLAPHQVTLIPVSNEKHVDYAWEVAKKLRDRGVRAEVDERNEKMQFKIRASQTQKIPYQLIVGDKEMKDGTVNVRRYGQKQTHTETVSEFVENILADIARKSRPDAE